MITTYVLRTPTGIAAFYRASGAWMLRIEGVIDDAIYLAWILRVEREC